MKRIYMFLVILLLGCICVKNVRVYAMDIKEFETEEMSITDIENFLNYGHRLQLDDMGVINYTTNIAIPSVTANILDRRGKLPYDYYGSPWEAGADELGGVHRTSNNTPWPEEACDSYGDLIKLFFE